MEAHGHAASSEPEICVSGLPIIIAELDEYYRLQSASEGYETWFGVDPQHGIGRHIRDIIGDEAFTTLEPRLSTALSGAEATFHGEVLYAHCGRRFIQSVYTPHDRTQGSGTGVQMVVSDLTPYLSTGKRDPETERESSEARENLAHANRITAMGELAAGLAHEISQPLTAIQATAEACRSMLTSGSPDPDMLAEALDQITTQSQRTTSIVQELRDFVRKGNPGQLSRHNPESLVNNVLPLLSHELERAGVNVRCLHETPLDDCLINRIQIEQVLVNLMRNAIEAMNGHEGDRILRIHSRPRPGEQCCEIDIEDTGPGIPPEHMNRLFDPFFTTKTQGMGQGLAICKSIIERHGGHLKVEPPETGGTLFRIILPREHQGAGASVDD